MESLFAGCRTFDLYYCFFYKFRNLREMQDKRLAKMMMKRTTMAMMMTKMTKTTAKKTKIMILMRMKMEQKKTQGSNLVIARLSTERNSREI